MVDDRIEIVYSAFRDVFILLHSFDFPHSTRFMIAIHPLDSRNIGGSDNIIFQPSFITLMNDAFIFVFPSTELVSPRA